MKKRDFIKGIVALPMVLLGNHFARTQTANKPVPNKTDEFDQDDIGFLPQFTFSSFVVAQNNKEAHAACIDIAKNPSGNMNPLFISGPSGDGKTHLLHAIENHVKKYFPKLRVRYVSVEAFTDEFIWCIRNNCVQKFRKQYQSGTDVLLLDDVSFLAGKETVQHEILNILEVFLKSKKQLIVAGTDLPQNFRGISESVRTRLTGGLLVQIYPPELDVRKAMLRFKLETRGMALDEKSIELISDKSLSPREMDGHLTRLKYFSELNNEPISYDLVCKLLKYTDLRSVGRLT